MRRVWAWSSVLAGVVALLLVATAAAAAAAQDMPGERNCVECHLGLDQERLVAPAQGYATDVHAEKGLGCLACHGAVAAGAAMGTLDPTLGFIARPSREQIPELCGSCHSDIRYMKRFAPSLRVDQLAEYWTSGHGQALLEGDPDVPTCATCHPPHGIRPPDDPGSSVHPTRIAGLCGSCHADPARMASHDLPTDQQEEYRASVHGEQLHEGGDLSAPTCNDCHGNHGASPPEVASVERVCGHCHGMMAELFEGSGHDVAFSDHGLPGCATCHDNHRIERPTDGDLVVLAEAVCTQCHASGDSAAAVFHHMAGWIDSLEVARAEADAVLRRAENLGMEVSQAQFELEEVTTAATKARTAIHALTLQPVLDEVDAGLAAVTGSRARGEDALKDHRVRRLGLAGSTAIILALVIALILKIRQLERTAGTAVATARPAPRRTRVRS